MLVAVLPGGTVLVRIEAPSENEPGAVLVGFLLLAHGRPDHPGEIAVGPVSELVARLRMTDVGLDAGQRRAALALRCLAGAALQLFACQLRIDLRHAHSHSYKEGRRGRYYSGGMRGRQEGGGAH